MSNNAKKPFCKTCHKPAESTQIEADLYLVRCDQDQTHRWVGSKDKVLRAVATDKLSKIASDFLDEIQPDKVKTVGKTICYDLNEVPDFFEVFYFKCEQ